MSANGVVSHPHDVTERRRGSSGASYSAYRTLASRSRVQILHVLQEQGDSMGVEAIGARVGLHPNTTREHLDRLVAGGFVERESDRRGTRGRPRLLYRAVDRPAALTMDERARDHLTRLLVTGYGRPMESPAAEAESAGRRWAEELESPLVTSTPGEPWAQLVALEQHLEDLGLDPEVDTEKLEVHLFRCPFLSLAKERTDVVCSVHLGLVKGVLARQGGPVCAERLDPFVGPSHCILRLGLEA